MDIREIGYCGHCNMGIGLIPDPINHQCKELKKLNKKIENSKNRLNKWIVKK